MTTTTELESIVILKYGRPEFTNEYIYSLPVEVADNLARLYKIPPDFGSVYGRLLFNIPSGQHQEACHHMFRLLCEYESRTRNPDLHQVW